MALIDDIKWALDEFGPANRRMLNYSIARRYYNGDHELAFATDKYRSQFWDLFRTFSLNMCESVVDVQAENLEIVGFTSNAATSESLPDGGFVVDDPPADEAWDAWESGGFDAVADELHRHVLQFGDGFLIADQAPDQSWTLFPQDPGEMAVRYSTEGVARIDLAAKLWIEVESWRLNLYYPEGTVRIRFPRPAGGTTARIDPQTATFLESFDNTLGRVPVWHFPNRRLSGYGVSELANVIPVQDALNKAVCDLLVSMEFQAYRQRYVTGWDPELDEEGKPVQPPQHGAGEILVFGGEDVKVGEFDQADLQPFLAVKNAFQADIARIAGVPLNYFFVSTSESPSGEALKTAEVRYARKTRRQKRVLGKQWEDALAAISLAPEGTDLNAVWAEISSRSESENLDVLTKKQALGVPNSQLQREIGYDADQIRQFAKEAGRLAKQLTDDQPPPSERGTIPS